MPTEADLRKQFHDPERPQGSGSVDLDAVLRRSRARRRPRVVAVAVVSSLAALAIVVPISVSGVLGQTGMFSASSGVSAGNNQDAAGHKAANQQAPGSASGGTATGGALNGSGPVQKVNLCSGTVADIVPASNGLVLTVEPVTAAATDRAIPVTVTLTNTNTNTNNNNNNNNGAVSFSGTTSPYPSLTLSRDGIVLWHSNGAVPAIGATVHLASGASMSFTTTFEPVVCGVTDDERTAFRAELPAAGPGHYQLSAALDVSSDDGTSVRVTGPAASVILR
jgi:hypothetical protein